MSHNRYSLQKEKKKYKAEIKGTLDGFRVTPKNEVPYEGVTVQRMTVMNPSFIEKVIKKKIKRKLDSYMQYIIKILESDNDDETGIDVALNDLERLKATIKHKYRIYLDKKYV